MPAFTGIGFHSFTFAELGCGSSLFQLISWQCAIPAPIVASRLQRFDNTKL